jgi:hypothetical protein
VGEKYQSTTVYLLQATADWLHTQRS